MKHVRIVAWAAVFTLARLLGLQSATQASEEKSDVQLRISASDGQLIAEGTLASRVTTGESSSDRLSIVGADGSTATVQVEWDERRNRGRTRFEDGASGWWLEELCEGVILGGETLEGMGDYLTLRAENRISEVYTLRDASGLELVWESDSADSGQSVYEGFSAAIAELHPAEIEAVPASARRTARWSAQMLVGRTDGTWVRSLPKFLALVEVLAKRSGGEAASGD